MRRVFKKSVAIALAAAMVITAAPANQAGAAKKASMAKKASVAVGKTVTIKIKNSNKKAKVTWKTSKKSVAKILKKGTVTKGKKACAKIKGVKKGTAKITATYKVGKKSQKFTCTVTVKKAKAPSAPSATPASSAVTNPTATPATGTSTATPAPTKGANTEPTVAPTTAPTKVPATPRPSATPSPAPKNASLDATNLGKDDVITVDGNVGQTEWENVGKPQNLLANPNSVRGTLAEGTTATARIAWADNAVYFAVESSAEMAEVKVFIDEDGDDTNKNAKSATATLAADKKAAEAKIDLAAAPNIEKGLKAEIQVKIGDTTINYFDSITEIKYDEAKKEWNFVDNGIKAGTDDAVLGMLNLKPSLAQSTNAYFTDKQAEILAASGLESAPWENEPAEGETEPAIKTKKINFVDTKYWTEAYAANGSESIFFTNVNIPGWQGNADRVGLATEVFNEDGTKKDPREFKSSRDNAQGYIIWDKQYLYVLFDINDSDISPANTDHYTTDSTEFFLDENYSQPKSYGEGDGDEVQLRVDAADGAFSSNDAGTGNYKVVGHAVNYKEADGKKTGYQIEYIIKLNNEHSNGHIMGMDLQINDCYTEYTYKDKVDENGNVIYQDKLDENGEVVKDKDGNPEKEAVQEIDTSVDPTAARASTLTAYDTTNNDYQDPSCFGRVKLINKAEPEPGATPEPKPTAVPAFDISTAVKDVTPSAIQVNAPITVDGTIDTAWNDVPAYAVKSASEDSQALVKLAWDADALYALVRVKDAAFDSTAADDYKRDGGEIFLDEDNSKEDTYTANTDAFQFRYSGFDAEDKTTKKITAGCDAAKEAYAGIEAAHLMVDDGYIVEYKIPWANKDAIEAGKIIGLEVNVFDCANGERAQEMFLLTNGGALYNNPSLFGEVELKGGEYVLDLSKDLWSQFSDVVTNDDGSVTLTMSSGAQSWQAGEFGFIIPKAVADAHSYSKFIVEYKDATAATGVGYVAHFGSTNPAWSTGEVPSATKLTIEESGTLTLDCGTGDANLGTVRFFDYAKGNSITIVSVKAVK